MRVDAGVSPFAGSMLWFVGVNVRAVSAGQEVSSPDSHTGERTFLGSIDSVWPSLVWSGLA